MASNIEARLERAVTQIEAMDNRLDRLGVQQKGDLDEVKLMIAGFVKDTCAAEEKKLTRLEAREKSTDMRVTSLETWRSVLVGAGIVLTVFGSGSWYLTSNLILDELRAIRMAQRAGGTNAPHPAPQPAPVWRKQ